MHINNLNKKIIYVVLGTILLHLIIFLLLQNLMLSQYGTTIGQVPVASVITTDSTVDKGVDNTKVVEFEPPKIEIKQPILKLQRGTIIIIAAIFLACAAAGTVTYFGIRFIKNRVADKEVQDKHLSTEPVDENLETDEDTDNLDEQFDMEYEYDEPDDQPDEAGEDDEKEFSEDDDSMDNNNILDTRSAISGNADPAGEANVEELNQEIRRLKEKCNRQVDYIENFSQNQTDTGKGFLFCLVDALNYLEQNEMVFKPQRQRGNNNFTYVLSVEFFDYFAKKLPSYKRNDILEAMKLLGAVDSSGKSPETVYDKKKVLKVDDKQYLLLTKGLDERAGA